MLSYSLTVIRNDEQQRLLRFYTVILLDWNKGENMVRRNSD